MNSRRGFIASCLGLLGSLVGLNQVSGARVKRLKIVRVTQLNQFELLCRQTLPPKPRVMGPFDLEQLVRSAEAYNARS